eukprot:scaffold6385_cov115-Pinguiococcus_pyrenoidosus.AAC.1
MVPAGFRRELVGTLARGCDDAAMARNAADEDTIRPGRIVRLLLHRIHGILSATLRSCKPSRPIMWERKGVDDTANGDHSIG